jgi:predicted Fe-Mo cluster-binding NifX family protein
MIVAVSSVNRDEKSYMDPRFGRSNCFYIVDTDSGQGRFVSNSQNFNAPHGAGIQTAQMVAGQGVDAVITGHVGPKASAVLEQEGIEVYLTEQSELTISEALEFFRQGKLKHVEGSVRSDS